MTFIAPLPKMTTAEYLDWEPRQEQRYEYVYGDVLAMTGGTVPHISSAGCGKLSGFSPEREATRGTTCVHVWSEVASDPCVAGLVPVCR
jgi:Uma2 family endonuclease